MKIMDMQKFFCQGTDHASYSCQLRMKYEMHDISSYENTDAKWEKGCGKKA